MLLKKSLGERKYSYFTSQENCFPLHSKETETIEIARKFQSPPNLCVPGAKNTCCKPTASRKNCLVQHVPNNHTNLFQALDISVCMLKKLLIN